MFSLDIIFSVRQLALVSVLERMSLVKFIQGSMKDTAPIVDAFAGSDKEFWVTQIMESEGLPASMNKDVHGSRISHTCEVHRYFGKTKVIMWIQWGKFEDEWRLVIDVQENYFTAFHHEDPIWELDTPASKEIKWQHPNCKMVFVSNEEYDFVPETMVNIPVPFFRNGGNDPEVATNYNIAAALGSVYDIFSDTDNLCVVPGCGSFDTLGGKYGGYCQRCLGNCNQNKCRRCGHRFGFIDTKSGCHPMCACRNVYEENQLDAYLDQEVEKVKMGL